MNSTDKFLDCRSRYFFEGAYAVLFSRKFTHNGASAKAAGVPPLHLFYRPVLTGGLLGRISTLLGSERAAIANRSITTSEISSG